MNDCGFSGDTMASDKTALFGFLSPTKAGKVRLTIPTSRFLPRQSYPSPVAFLQETIILTHFSKILLYIDTFKNVYTVTNNIFRIMICQHLTIGIMERGEVSDSSCSWFSVLLSLLISWGIHERAVASDKEQGHHLLRRWRQNNHKCRHGSLKIVMY